MIPTEDCLRWLAHEARDCRDRDQSEAICLLLPPLMRFLALPDMDDLEARAFRERLRRALTAPGRRH